MKLTVKINAPEGVGMHELALLLGKIAGNIPTPNNMPSVMPLHIRDQRVGEATFEATPGEYGEPRERPG